MVIYRVGDLLPSLTIVVRDGNVVTDITTLDVLVRWQRADGSEIPERIAEAVDAANGVAKYDWVDGDLSVAGVMFAIIQLCPEGNPTQRYSLTNPPLVEIEVLANDFPAIDPTLSMLPTPTGSEVAALLQLQPSQVDGSAMLFAINRGKLLTYSYGELWRCPSLILDPTATRVVRQLVAELSAMSYATNPTVMYGPYRKETFGSYSYELKEGNVMSTRQQTGGKVGIPSIDAMIKYLDYLCHGCDSNVFDSIDISFPDWTQPVTETIPDPTIPVQ